MTTRKIYALCKKLGLSTTYMQDWGHGFYNAVEARTDELENRVMCVLRDKQLCWYEHEFNRLLGKEGLHLMPDVFKYSGLLICDGGTRDNLWKGVTWYSRVDPIHELWEMYQQEIAKGPKMPDLKAFERHCKQLARKHWKNKDSLPKEWLLPQEA